MSNDLNRRVDCTDAARPSPPCLKLKATIYRPTLPYRVLKAA